MKNEVVDVLRIPDFEISGITKTREQVYKDGDRIATFNLRIIKPQTKSVIFQIRSPKASRAPNKLDVSVGGHYRAGEKGRDGLREAEEELGKNYLAENLQFLGRRLNLTYDTEQNLRKSVVHIYITEDNSELSSYKLDPEEVYGICECPIDEVIKSFEDPKYSFTTQILLHDQNSEFQTINSESFPYNRDNYMYKMALLTKKHLNGEKNIIY